MSRRVAGYTLGCKVNDYDTEAMLEVFEKAGWEIVGFDEDADCYVVNTCTVTHTGDVKSRKLIHRVAREHPGSAIIAAGCLTQREPEEMLACPGVMLAIGVQKRGDVVRLLEQALQEGHPIDATASLTGIPFEKLSVTRHEGKTRAYMKIQEGCSRRCTYCIIPDVRGPIRGMSLDDIREEAARLAGEGYREIVVTGIHLGSYEKATGVRITDALRAVCKTPGIERVRLGSLEPGIVTEDFARCMADEEKMMRQFHLALQSGSAGVLLRMKRGYTPDMFRRAVERLRSRMDDPAITTDIITGFPGETDEEFEETMRFTEEIGFARLHVFPYSNRVGTPADTMPGQVPEEVKKIRTARLIALGNKLSGKYVSSKQGHILSVLFETEQADGYSTGYSSEYVHVRAKAQPGSIRRVRITGTRGDMAEGVTEGGEADE